MIKKLWDSINYKWYRAQYRKASNAFLFADYCAVVLMIATVVFANITGGIVIGSMKDTIVRALIFFSILVIIVSVVISMTLSVVDNYERKLSEGKQNGIFR